MQINSIQHQSFGNITITSNAKMDMIKSILASSESADTYRTALADIIDALSNDTLNMDAVKLASGECRINIRHNRQMGASCHCSGKGFLWDLLLALKKNRTPEYSNFLKSLIK